jgi:hypothetical protein
MLHQLNGWLGNQVVNAHGPGCTVPGNKFSLMKKKHNSSRETVIAKQKIGADKQSASANFDGHRNEK